MVKVLPGDEEVQPLRAAGRWLVVEVKVAAPTTKPVLWAQVAYFGNRLLLNGRPISPDADGSTQAAYRYGPTSLQTQFQSGAEGTGVLAYDLDARAQRIIRSKGGTIEFADGAEINFHMKRNQVGGARRIGILRVSPLGG